MAREGAIVDADHGSAARTEMGKYQRFDAGIVLQAWHAGRDGRA